MSGSTHAGSRRAHGRGRSVRRVGREGLALGLGLGMLGLGGPAMFREWPRDGERAGGREGPAPQQEVSLEGRGLLRRHMS